MIYSHELRIYTLMTNDIHTIDIHTLKRSDYVSNPEISHNNLIYFLNYQMLLKENKMRYIPTGCLRESMLLGKSIYGENEMLFLSKGQKLSNKNILTINNLGYQGIYITDNFSNDIEVVNIIGDELRQKMISSVKNVFLATESNNKISIDKTFENGKKLVEDMVNG